MEIANGKHVVLVKLPDYLRAPGHLLIIFGAQNVSLFQLSPSSLQPQGYSYLGTQQVSAQEATADMKLSSVKLVARACTQLGESAELTFLIGWSKGKSLEQVKLELHA